MTKRWRSKGTGIYAGLLIGLAILALSFIAYQAGSAQSQSMETQYWRVSVIDESPDHINLHTERLATATQQADDPTATDNPPTATDVPPTATEDLGDTPTSMELWHAPGAHDGLHAHEHGDAPPAWADAFSVANFGHPVMFGGDEATPNENVLKHWAFKGYSVTFLGDGPNGQDDAGGPVEIYFRAHMQSNPMGHMARYHSYEVYAKDASGNVSFWQGWLDFALPGTTVPHIADGDCEDDSQRPIMGVNKLGCGGYSFESWYSRPGGPTGFWTWDTGINSQAPYYHDAADPMDINTWNRAPDGNHGLTRRVELAWYADRAAAVPKDAWFCTQVTGEGIGLATNNEPDGCAEGVPQYIASTMPSVSFTSGAGSPATGANSVQKTYPGAGVVEQPN